jgi:hypothetical protein
MKQLLSSLTQEQINFYYEKGYLIVNDVLTEEECDIYNNQVRKQANNDFQAILNPDRIEFLISQTLEKINISPDKKEILRVFGENLMNRNV